MKTNRSFKIIFQDQDSKIVDVQYYLHDTNLAIKWFSKIKHLSKLPIDDIESGLADVSNLHQIYEKFCDFAQIDKSNIKEKPDQIDCNMLHKIYEENHDRLSRKTNNDILYKFHHAIHNTEKDKSISKDRISIGWGVKEGPLTDTMHCQPYYENKLHKNNLYLPWAELGKTPYTYWKNMEPRDQTRFNILCKPHITFRAKFFIALKDQKNTLFPNQFNQYFNQFKARWLNNNGIKDWTEKDEWCAPLLAHTEYTGDISSMVFRKIVI